MHIRKIHSRKKYFSTKTPVYVKITNDSETHHGFIYKTGLNIDTIPFQKNGSCVAGGLYFTTIDHIKDFFSWGCYIREIYLPTNDSDFQMVPVGTKFRASKIILGPRYSLFDDYTYEHFHLTKPSDRIMFELASKYDRVDILKKLIKSKPQTDLSYIIDAIDSASANGHTDVLNWWLESDLELRYSKESIDSASANGHINVLDWWLTNKNNKRFNLLGKPKSELLYTSDAIDLASKNGHINILNWWVRSKLRLKYTTNVIRHNHINILDWWFKFRPTLISMEEIIDTASAHGHVNVLDWWISSRYKLQLNYSSCAIDLASKRSHINVLIWWKKSGLELKYTEDAMDWASLHGHIDVLDWWKESGFELKYSTYAMDWASKTGKIDVLNWWIQSDLDLIYSEDAMDWASQYGHIHILEWWKNSKLKLKYSKNAICHILAGPDDYGARNWWRQSGLEFKNINLNTE